MLWKRIRQKKTGKKVLVCSPSKTHFILFNKRLGGEGQRITLNQYLSRPYCRSIKNDDTIGSIQIHQKCIKIHQKRSELFATKIVQGMGLDESDREKKTSACHSATRNKEKYRFVGAKKGTMLVSNLHFSLQTPAPY